MSRILAGAFEGLGSGLIDYAKEMKAEALREQERQEAEKERQQRFQSNRAALDQMYSGGGGGGDGGSRDGMVRGADPLVEEGFRRAQKFHKGGHKFRGLGNLGDFKGDGVLDMGKDVEEMSAALALIRKKEGFREKPYYDVDAYRAGYGSDTVTRADGTVERISSKSRVTREDAERDLKRRAQTEFMPSARSAVGDEAFSRLNEEQQAVMVSLAYNYGAGAWDSSLRSVAEAVRNGGDVEGEIRALGRHNDGINQSRRNYEADIFAGKRAIEGATSRPETYEMFGGQPLMRRGLGGSGGAGGSSTLSQEERQSLIEIASDQNVDGAIRRQAVEKLEGASKKPADKEKRKITGEQWIPYEDGKEALAGYDEEGNVVLRQRDGKPVTRDVEKPADKEKREITISSGLDTRLQKRFASEDDFGESSPDWDTIDAVRGEVMRLMEVEGLSESKAEQKAIKAMQYRKGEDEERVFTGQFQYGPRKNQSTPAMPGDPGGAPRSPQQPRANKPAAPAQPKTKAEYDALPSGARYIDPDGNERVKK